MSKGEKIRTRNKTNIGAEPGELENSKPGVYLTYFLCVKVTDYLATYFPQVLQQAGGKTQEDILLMKKELEDENTLIGLLKTELVNHKKYWSHF